MTKEHNKICNYSWLNDLPDWANLKTNDLLKIFGYSSQQSLSCAVSRGIFPKPDIEIKVPNKKGMPRVFWTVATIKKEIVRRKNLEKENV